MKYEHTLNDIKWEEIDDKFQYASQDLDGSIWVWVHKPSIVGARWMPGVNYPRDTFTHIKNNFKDGGVFLPWRDALISRPVAPAVKVPDGHPHATLMAEYAKDAANNKEPWKLWEYKTSGVPSLWNQLYGHPEWREQVEYRRKIKTVTITIPEDVAIEFVNLCHIANASKVVCVAIQEALNHEHNS